MFEFFNNQFHHKWSTTIYYKVQSVEIKIWHLKITLLTSVLFPQVVHKMQKRFKFNHLGLYYLVYDLLIVPQNTSFILTGILIPSCGSLPLYILILFIEDIYGYKTSLASNKYINTTVVHWNWWKVLICVIAR